jgi:hypothetical protein
MKFDYNIAATFGNIRLKRYIILSCLLVSLIMISVLESAAQDDELQMAPPPLKLISKFEKERLDAISNPKERTKVLLEMMRARVAVAEKLSATREYSLMYTELGGFHALMDDGLDYLKKRDNENKNVLNTFKKLEIGLREFPPRLEALRRDLPLKYEDYVRRLINYLRVARTVATEPLFGDTVMPNDPTSNDTPKN